MRTPPRTVFLRSVGLAALFVVASLALTWPLALHLKTHIPLGSETAATVPNLNLWSLWWNLNRLPHAYQGYWDAPIFAPLQGTFAFSEPHFLTGLLAAPLWLATHDVVLAYNFILLVFLMLNGACAYLLMRGLSIEPLPAQLSAHLIQALPFVTRELGVLQLTALFAILLTLHFARRFAISRAPRDALGLSLSVAATYLITNYYALMLSFFLLALAPFVFRREWLAWQPVATLLLAALLGAALLAPFVLRQQAILKDYLLTRSTEIIAANSASLADYAFLPRATIGYRLWNRRVTLAHSQRLYPGSGLLVFGVWGAIAGWRRREWRRWSSFCIAGVVLALTLSCGLNLNTASLGLPAWQPYEVLRAAYPGLRQLRSPFRFGLFVQLFLALLAGLGLAAIYRGWRWSGRRWALIALCTLALAELFPAPLRLAEVPYRHDESWMRWLARQPPGTVVAHVPFPESGEVEDLEQTTRWMLAQIRHGQPMVNGYSGFSPTSYLLLQSAMSGFPNTTSLAALRRREVAYVLLDGDWITVDNEQAVADWRACLTPILESDSMTIMKLESPPACP